MSELTDRGARSLDEASADLERPIRLASARPIDSDEFTVVDTSAASDAPTWARLVSEAIAEAAPVHLVSVGAEAVSALALAAERPQLLTSLVLADPEVPDADDEVAAILARVEVPTLVIASAPTPDSSLVSAQAVAGGVDNGVFVIIDGAETPSLVTRPGSFVEWGTAFMVIAEGLAEQRF